MAHVMQATHQDHQMKQAMTKMDCITAYLVYDFKQKFLAKGFREGGDSYYGKKGMLWWGAGAYVKPCDEANDETVEPLEKLHVMIDFAGSNLPLQQQMVQVNDDEGDDSKQHESDDCKQHESEDGEQYESDDGEQYERDDGGNLYEVDDGEQHGVDDGIEQSEFESDGGEHAEFEEGN